MAAQYFKEFSITNSNQSLTTTTTATSDISVTSDQTSDLQEESEEHSSLHSVDNPFISTENYSDKQFSKKLLFECQQQSNNTLDSIDSYVTFNDITNSSSAQIPTAKPRLSLTKCRNVTTKKNTTSSSKSTSQSTECEAPATGNEPCGCGKIGKTITTVTNTSVTTTTTTDVTTYNESVDIEDLISSETKVISETIQSKESSTGTSTGVELVEQEDDIEAFETIIPLDQDNDNLVMMMDCYGGDQFVGVGDVHVELTLEQMFARFERTGNFNRYRCISEQQEEEHAQIVKRESSRVCDKYIKGKLGVGYTGFCQTMSASIYQQYAVLLTNEVSKLFENANALRRIARKSQCTIELTRKLLNRRYSQSTCWIKYLIILLDAQNRSNINNCLAMIRREFRGIPPITRHYGKLTPTLYMREMIPDNSNLLYHYQRTGSTMPRWGDLVLKTPLKGQNQTNLLRNYLGKTEPRNHPIENTMKLIYPAW